MPLFETVEDLRGGADVLRRRAYGVVYIESERLREIRLRPWPKVISLAEISLWGRGFHRRSTGDQCWLYYNQPFRHRNFLALKYLVSSRHATFATVHNALVVLDEIARLKRTDAIVCEVSNRRISERALQRWGWQSHVPQSRRRHFIKRFYGTYPEPDAAWAICRPPDEH